MLKDNTNGVWATTFDTLILSYVMKLNVIVIGNYLNGFSANSMHYYLPQLRLPIIIEVELSIRVYFNQFVSPLEMVDDGNHFVYLEPIT